MISPKLKSVIDSHIADLPSYHQEVLKSFDWVAITEEIAAKFRMNPRQSEMFVGEVAMLLMQITDPSMFRINLVNHIGVSDALAESIILNVQSRILTRLQTELEHIVGEVPDAMKVALMQAGIDAETADQFVQSQVYAPSTNETVVPQSNIITPSATPATSSNPDPYHEAID